MTEGAGEVANLAICGGACVTFHPNAYGDPSSQSFAASLPDLAPVPYGLSETLKGLVKAVLVRWGTTAVT